MRFRIFYSLLVFAFSGSSVLASVGEQERERFLVADGLSELAATFSRESQDSEVFGLQKLILLSREAAGNIEEALPLYDEFCAHTQPR